MAESVHALNGRIGALESWSRTKDRTARTAPAHSKSPCSLSYWLASVDPDGEMTPADRDKSAAEAHRAYMLRLSKRSADVRRAKKAGKSPS